MLILLLFLLSLSLLLLSNIIIFVYSGQQNKSDFGGMRGRGGGGHIIECFYEHKVANC